MTRISSLALVTLFLVTACSSEGGDDTTAASSSSTSDTDAPFAPNGGDYLLEAGTNGGTCDPDNETPGTVQFFYASVTVRDEVNFDLSLQTTPGNGPVWSCELAGHDFTCSGAAESELFVQTGPPDARAAMSISVAGTFPSETTIEIQVTGELACTGDPVGCDEAQADFGLEWPCTMTNLHTGTLR